MLGDLNILSIQATYLRERIADISKTEIINCIRACGHHFYELGIIA